MEKMEPVDIAAALVRAHRARLPAPEDLAEQGEGRERPDRQANIRAGFDDAVWFRINVGRRQNADPRWLLPLLCRRGHVTKNEVGAIRIGPTETGFAIASAAAGRFVKALARTAQEADDGILVEPLQGGPREAARENRRAAPKRGGPAQRPYRPKRNRAP
jgi:ATP-dependent RNA helicase DeaD